MTHLLVPWVASSSLASQPSVSKRIESALSTIQAPLPFLSSSTLLWFSITLTHLRLDLSGTSERSVDFTHDDCATFRPDRGEV